MDIVEEIKQRLDIVDLIGSYVTLQKAGHNYKGLCPFHQEKTPSFIVFPDTQTWHCFGACSTGGDIFSFIMRYENLDFRGALRVLAERAGISLRPLSEQERERQQQIERLRRINAIAAEYYHQTLLASDAARYARNYLKERGVAPETITAFQIGYAPDAWHALQEHLQSQGFSVESGLEAGLLVQSDRGRIYDRFRKRIIFPIRDVRGYVVGFGGRALGDGEPKYINTPQTLLFDKGSILYGIHLARDTIRETGTVVLVEGYMDVIIPHQFGFHNLVAVMGTALTEAHINVLRPITQTLILAFDPDEAGRRAVERSVETARTHLSTQAIPVPTPSGILTFEEKLEAEIRILTLPEGLDPDEVVRSNPSHWEELVTQALPVAEYLTNRVLDEEDVRTAKGKRRAAERLLPIFATIVNPVERSHYVQQLARRIQVDERLLFEDLERLRRRKRRSRSNQPSHKDPAQQTATGQGIDSHTKLEIHCLQLLLRAPQLLSDEPFVNLIANSLLNESHRQLLEQLRQVVNLIGSAQPTLEEILSELDSETKQRVESLLHTRQSYPDLPPEMIREDLAKSSTRLRKSYLTHLIGELRFVQQDAQQEGDRETILQLNQTIKQLTQEYREIERRYHAATFQGRRQNREQWTSNDHRA